MADSRLRAGNIQDDSGTFCHAAKQESHQRPIMLCQKSSGDNLKKFPVAKYGSKWTSARVITVMDWNT